MQTALREAMQTTKEIPHRHSSAFYIVYLNNLTPATIAQIDQGLSMRSRRKVAA